MNTTNKLLCRIDHKPRKILFMLILLVLFNLEIRKTPRPLKSSGVVQT